MSTEVFTEIFSPENCSLHIRRRYALFSLAEQTSVPFIWLLFFKNTARKSNVDIRLFSHFHFYRFPVSFQLFDGSKRLYKMRMNCPNRIIYLGKTESELFRISSKSSIVPSLLCIGHANHKDKWNNTVKLAIEFLFLKMHFSFRYCMSILFKEFSDKPVLTTLHRDQSFQSTDLNQLQLSLTHQTDVNDDGGRLRIS
jgi:hypothetical protein